MAIERIEKTRDFVTRAAGRHGWVVNPDKEHLADVIEGLSVNFSRFSYYLCPCRDGSGDRKADADIICPCTYARADCEEYGHCYCGLFFTPEYAQSGNPAEPIPERRSS